jgi:type III pantothenate kinase
MLLTIDCGNTNTGFAMFEGERCVGSWRTSTAASRTADEYAVWLSQLLALDGLSLKDIEDVIIANVVPDTAFNLKTLCRRHFGLVPMLVGSPEVDLGIEVRIDNPKEVGADRVVNAIGAASRYDGALIVIDFGTATTFDVVESDGGYAGGVIAPGINLSLEALYNAAAQLPRIVIEQPEASRNSSEPTRIIGKNTREAMRAGIFWGYVGLINGIVGQIKAEYGQPMTVIATGGLAPIFLSSTDAIQHVDPDITLRGLVLIHQRNKR